MKLLKRIKRFIKIQLFIYRVWNLSSEFHKLREPVERMQYLLINFGKDGIEILQEHEAKLRIDTKDAFNGL